jgi:hypothetical protein
MRGFIGFTSKEKEDILKQHSTPYDGYSVRSQNNNMYPLTVYDNAKDKGGITLDNNNNPGYYRNHKINEIAAKNLHYDEIDDPYEFDSNGPGDPNLGYDVYNGTLPAYDFDSQGPSDPYYGGITNLGDEEESDNENKEFEFDMVDFGDYIDNENEENITEEVIKTLDMFKRFKKFN